MGSSVYQCTSVIRIVGCWLLLLLGVVSTSRGSFLTQITAQEEIDSQTKLHPGGLCVYGHSHSLMYALGLTPPALTNKHMHTLTYSPPVGQ